MSNAANARPAPAAPRTPAPLGEVLALALQILGALFAFAAVVAVVDRLFHDALMTAAARLTDGLGVVGFGLGTLLADGVHVPVPPQAYMVAAISDGRDVVGPLVAIVLGSLGGGVVAYAIASWAGRLRPLESRLERVRLRVDGLRARYGERAVVVAALLPIPYSFLCYAAGALRWPRRELGIVLALRVPKLLAYYAVVALAMAR